MPQINLLKPVQFSRARSLLPYKPPVNRHKDSFISASHSYRVRSSLFHKVTPLFLGVTALSSVGCSKSKGTLNEESISSALPLIISACVLIGVGVVAHARMEYNAYKQPILDVLIRGPKTSKQIADELKLESLQYKDGRKMSGSFFGRSGYQIINPILRQLEREGWVTSEERHENLEEGHGDSQIYYRRTGKTQEDGFWSWFRSYVADYSPV